MVGVEDTEVTRFGVASNVDLEPNSDLPIAACSAVIFFSGGAAASRTGSLTRRC